jgi:hypothetical protein
LAVDIPIWPGSSSFTTGMTPNGYYDSDPVFQNEVDKVAKWCATKLGYPMIDIEVQDIHFYSAFEEAITEFSAYVNSYNIKDNLIYLQGVDLNTGSNYNDKVISRNFGNMINMAKEYGSTVGVGGEVNYKSGSILLQRGQNKIDLKSQYADIYESGSAITITRVFNNPTPAAIRYLLPLTSQNQTANAFGFGQYSTAVNYMMMPLHGDVLRMQLVEFNDQIRRSQYSFELINNQLKIFPIPQEPRRIHFEYFVDNERNNPLRNNKNVISDYSNAPYQNKTYAHINGPGKQWIKKYAYALSMETLGNVRSKYSSIPIPDSDINLDGDALKSAAETLKQDLINELKEMLEQLTSRALLEAEQQKSEMLLNTMKNIPLKIYVG